MRAARLDRPSLVRTAEYFEAVAKGRDAKAAANWVMGDLFGTVNRLGLGIEDSPVVAAHSAP